MMESSKEVHLQISCTHIIVLDREKDKPPRILPQKRLLDMASIHLGQLMLRHHDLPLAHSSADVGFSIYAVIMVVLRTNRGR